jgi:hypothetical protein
MPATAPASSRVVAITDNTPPPLITRDQLAVDFAHLSASVLELEDAFKVDVPSVLEDDEDLAIVTRNGTVVIALLKRIEDARKEQVKPFQAAETTVNDFLKRELPNRLATIKTALERLSTAYQRKKAAREQKVRDDHAKAARDLAAQAAAKVAEAVKIGDVKAATVAVTESNSLTAFANKAAAAAAVSVNSMAKLSTDAGSASLVDNWTFEDLDLDKIDLVALRPFFPRAAVEQAMRAFIKSGRREIAGARIFNDNRTRFRG